MVYVPSWAAKLRHTDRLELTARLEMHQDNPQERDETLESWKERAESPDYLIRQSVHGGSPLKPKDIILPEVSTKDDSPLDWFMAEFMSDRYATEGEFYASVQEDRVEEWTETVRAFEAKPNDFYNAWYYLNGHPAFWQFRRDDGVTAPEERITERNLVDDWGVHTCVDIHVTKVHHATGWVEENQDNTVTEVWIELGPYRWPASAREYDHVAEGETYPRDYPSHDPALDCGGASMESAFIAAAVNVHTYYGNDRRACDKTVSSDG